MIRHSITDMINRGNRNIIWHTYTLLASPGSNKVVSFVLYKLTHVPLYQPSKNVAELKSLAVAASQVISNILTQS
jgi:hypothetical protein